MKKLSFILVSIFTANYLNAETIELKEGWNLIGLSNSTTIEKLKSENKSIEKVYIYENEFIDSGEIQPSNGIWVYSNENLTLSEEFLSANEILDENVRVDKITLNSGWNLISLPINSAISPKIFKNVNAIWKYSNKEWEQYGENENSKYRKIYIIDTKEGFWVNSKSNQTLYLSDEEAKFINFNSKEEMNDYLSAMAKHNSMYKNDIYKTNYDSDGIPIPIPTTSYIPTTTSTTSNIQIENVTTTNIQEEGVDEADIVKHDGEKIFYLPALSNTKEIYVNTFERVLAGDTQKLTSIKVNTKPNELYLIDNKLIAIYPSNYSFWGNWNQTDYNIWSKSSKIEVYNVSDLENITKINEYKIDGNIVDSRVTNNKLYLVTKFLPYVKVDYEKIYMNCAEYYYNGIINENNTTKSVTTLTPITKDGVKGDDIIVSKVYDGNGEPTTIITNTTGEIVDESTIPSGKNGYLYCYYYYKDNGTYYRPNYDKPILTKEYLKPSITNEINNTSKDILNVKTLYAPTKINQNNFITSITSFDINDFSNQESISVVGDSLTLYATNKAIYIATLEYPIYFNWINYKGRTTIYKFSIDDNLSYRGKTFVDGVILNQFSLSEYNNILRVASTDIWNWKSNINNMVSTIGESEGNINVIGKLDGLGKEGETIRGVRFLGNRGFIVTFKQSDPLYTIDLSDPTNPTKVGELNITGYSSYFHPIDENRILSIGRDANENGQIKGVQVELFNISDFANPILADKIIIGEDSATNTEVESNYKAFTYRSSDNLFAFPITQYTQIEQLYKNYLNIYQIDGFNLKEIETIKASDTSSKYDSQRGVIFTKDSIDYGLYIVAGELYLKEITK